MVCNQLIYRIFRLLPLFWILFLTKKRGADILRPFLPLPLALRGGRRDSGGAGTVHRRLLDVPLLNLSSAAKGTRRKCALSADISAVIREWGSPAAASGRSLPVRRCLRPARRSRQSRPLSFPTVSSRICSTPLLTYRCRRIASRFGRCEKSILSDWLQTP